MARVSSRSRLVTASGHNQPNKKCDSSADNSRTHCHSMMLSIFPLTLDKKKSSSTVYLRTTDCHYQNWGLSISPSPPSPLTRFSSTCQSCLQLLIQLQPWQPSIDHCKACFYSHTLSRSLQMTLIVAHPLGMKTTSCQITAFNTPYSHSCPWHEQAMTNYFVC